MKASAVAFFLLAPLLAHAQTGAWGQCGGINFSGSTSCVSGYYCRYQNDWYSQCVPGTATTSSAAQPTTTSAPSSSAVPTSSPTSTAPVSTPTAAPGTGWVIPPAQPGTLGEKIRVNKNGRYFGTAGDQGTFSVSAIDSIVKSEFSVVTHENTMKWESIQPSRGQFNFAGADWLMNYAATNNKLVRGHTLVWHSQLPQWVQNINDRATLTSVIETHIKTILARYKGKIFHWDVVNEVFEENGTFRNSVFYRVLGESFIELAFRTAHAADPDAILYINDYNLDYEGPKLNAMIALVNKLRAAGVPVHGIGSQAHLIVGNGAVGAVPTTLAKLAATGAEVAITELDIRMTTPSNASKLAQQSRDYETVIRACLALPKCVGISVWGVDDGNSWVPYTFSGEGEPLLWTADFQKKPAYSAVSALLN